MQAIACILLLVGAFPLASGQSDVRFPQADQKLNVYLYVGSDRQPALTLNATEAKGSTASSHLLGGGPQSLANSLQGETSTSFDFIDLRVPLPKTYYLNLSKDFTGTLAWASDVSSAAKAEVARVRVELFLDDVRIGGGESLSQLSRDWQTVTFGAHSEVNQLEAGKKLRLRVTQLAGLSNLRVGTDPDSHLTAFSFYYFDQDPLAGPLVAKGGKLYATPTSPDNTSRTASTAPIPLPPTPATWSLGVLLVAPIGLAALPRRGRRAALAHLLVLLFLALAFGGCLEGKKISPTVSTPDATDTLFPTQPFADEEAYTWDAQLKKFQHAAIRGQVRDWLGLPIAKVNVSFFGTDRYVITKEDGMFRFTNLSTETPPVLEYALIFDHVDYTFYEVNVKTKVEYYAWKNVTLVRPEEVGVDGTEHLHDEYGALKEKPIYKDDAGFLPADAQPDHHLVDSFVALSEDSWICYATASGCQAPLLIKYDLRETTKMWSGSGRVQVKLTWDTSGPYAPPEVGLRVQTNGNIFSVQYPNNPPTPRQYTFNYRGPGDPFNIAIWPHEADPGHQSFTNWEFTILLPPLSTQVTHPSSAGNPATHTQPLFWMGGKFQVEMTGFKGKAIYEIPHSAIWKGRTEIELIRQDYQTRECKKTNFDYPDFETAYSDGSTNTKPCRWELSLYQTQLPSGWFPNFVPPGTREVRGTFQITEAQPLTNWGLLFKGADAPIKSRTGLGVVELNPTGNEGEYAFAIPLTDKPWKTDSYYQSKSMWVFYPDDNDQPVKGQATTTGGTTFRLTAVAVKDPASKAL